MTKKQVGAVDTTADRVWEIVFTPAVFSVVEGGLVTLGGEWFDAKPGDVFYICGDCGSVVRIDRDGCKTVFRQENHNHGAHYEMVWRGEQ